MRSPATSRTRSGARAVSRASSSATWSRPSRRFAPTSRTSSVAAGLAAHRVGGGPRGRCRFRGARDVTPARRRPHHAEGAHLQMAEQFGPTAQEVLTCGSHVHVGIGPRRRASPSSTGSAGGSRSSWPSRRTPRSPTAATPGMRRTAPSSRVRWPSAGPTDVFGTPAAYEALVASMVDSGVLLDDGMVYFDARLSHRYPTVEIRVADVCARPLRHDGRRRRLPGAGRDRRPGGGAGRAATTGAHGAPSAGHLARRSRRSGRVLVDPVTSRPGRPRWSCGGCSTSSGRRWRSSVTWTAWRPASSGCSWTVRGDAAAPAYERTGQLVDVVAEAVRLSAGA